ncbi:MAG: aldehyde ferredoxin oxidoreductase family protein [Planctomycetota bacterium]|jgi:aldehyde:ferredoxin oxidoreductase
MALNRKLAFIDLTSGEVSIEEIPRELREKYLGGRGLDIALLYEHLEPGVDPLGPQNVCCISAGVLVGTPASASARTHIMAKSPLTGLLGSSNMGGFFAPELRYAGFDHLVIRGKAEKPVFLWIHNGEIEIRDGSALWGLDTFETQEALREELADPEVKALAIGVAGENLVRFANVMTGHKNAAGRTGMGAVLGAKNLKAIAVRGTQGIDLAQPKEALEYDREVCQSIAGTKFGQIMQRWGTMFIYGVTNSTGLVRVNNFQSNQHPDSEKIECENMDEHSTGTAGCFGCQLHCRHRYVIKDGKYAGTYGEGPEYTSQGAWGAEVGCRDFPTILYGNHLVNKLGLDTLETGSLIAWGMELYEKGIVTNKDTGGLELKFGNEDAVIEMVRQIAHREGFGDVLADGPKGAMERLPEEAAPLCIQVKGMSNLHSDERPTPSLALGIATATRGSDHLRSRPAIDLYALPEPLLRKIYGSPVPYDGPLTSEYGDYEGKAWMVFWQEMLYMAVDCLGVCKFHTIFLSPNMPAFDEFSKWLELIPGLEMSPKDVWDVAERAYNLERLFNLREGATRKDDWLVDRYFDEPTPRGFDVVRDKALDRDKFKAMLDEYYEHHGWDKKGRVTDKTLERLDLVAAVGSN